MVPVNCPIRIVRNREETHEPVDVPANGRASTVPTRPSGSKSTRMDPEPDGSLPRLHDASPAVTRSSSFVARARGKAPSTVGVEAVGVDVGMKEEGGRETVDGVVAFVPGGLPLVAAAAEGSSRRGPPSGSTATGAAGGSGSAFETATMMTTTAPKPSSTTTPIPPRIQGSAEPFEACFPKPAGGGVPRGEPHDRQ